MSAPLPAREWLVQIPIIPGSLEKRLALRQQHFDEAASKIKDGTITFAGGILSKPTVDGDNKDMTMTLVTVNVETEEEARAIIKGDVYSVEGVWDFKKMQVFAFKTGLRVFK
ncbi:hypothetical protein ACJZ2D_006936 [Fusarium nematophilum]